MMRRAAVLVMLVMVFFPLPAAYAQTPESTPVLEDLPPEYEVATIKDHVDGDKIRVLVEGEDRELNFIGADAPEPGECFFRESSDYVEKLLPVDTVVYLERDEKDTDGSDRLLRYVWTADKKGERAYLVNAKLIRDGYAAWVSKDDNTHYDRRLKRAQEQAKEKAAGLWKKCGGPHEELADAACLEVPQVTIDGISSGVESGLTLSGWKAVRSDEFESVYMVAAKITGPGFGDGEIAVWAVNDLENPGMVLSAEALAAEFSDWPDGSSTDARINTTTHGVSEAEDCVE